MASQGYHETTDTDGDAKRYWEETAVKGVSKEKCTPAGHETTPGLLRPCRANIASAATMMISSSLPHKHLHKYIEQDTSTSQLRQTDTLAGARGSYLLQFDHNSGFHNRHASLTQLLPHSLEISLTGINCFCCTFHHKRAISLLRSIHRGVLDAVVIRQTHNPHLRHTVLLEEVVQVATSYHGTPERRSERGVALDLLVLAFVYAVREVLLSDFADELRAWGFRYAVIGPERRREGLIFVLRILDAVLRRERLGARMLAREGDVIFGMPVVRGDLALEPRTCQECVPVRSKSSATRDGERSLWLAEVFLYID